MEVDPSSSPNNIDDSTTEENPGENSNSGSTEQVTESGTSEYSELWMDFKCVFCNQDLKSIAHPKLLPCLHTACDSCLISESNGEAGATSSAGKKMKTKLFNGIGINAEVQGKRKSWAVRSTTGNRQLNCAACNQEINAEDTVDHLFLTEYVQNSEAQPEESSYPCTSCEEGAEGSAFCQNCQEWLCDTCVNAHHRVRVTKDHVVRPKEEMEGETSALRNQKYLICPTHSPEQLKLYCETCDKLTCRDCQLSDHKEHRYQFLAKACEEEKGNITELLNKIKEKQGHIEDASSNLNKRHEEIEDRERVVTQEIKTFSVKFITDINKRGKSLLQELNKVCSEKKNQLNFKNKELRTVAERLKHCQKFAHAAVTLGSETALVYSKKPIMNQLRRILRHRCEVPNPNHMVDIQFNYETNFLTQYISSLGHILVDSHPLPGSSANQNAMLPMPQNISPSPIASAPPMRQVSHIQINQRSVSVPVPVQQMNQQQLGPYGQPQVTSSTDLARTPSNNPQMRQVLANNKMINYNQNHMQPRARVQQPPQSNYNMQANAGYTPRHVMHQQQPQAQIRQHPQVQQQQQQQQQQQVPMQQQQQQVQQQNYTQQNNPNQLPMPLRQNKSISVTALPSPSGPSPSKQRAIAPRAAMNMNAMNNQNNVQRITNTQASPHRPQGPQVIVIDDQPQKTPTMSNTSRLSHFPSSIAATIAANPQLQIQPANYNNSILQGPPTQFMIRIPIAQNTPNAGIVQLLQQPVFMRSNAISPAENRYSTPPPPYDMHTSMPASTAPNVMLQNTTNVSTNLDSTLKALLTWSKPAASLTESPQISDFEEPTPSTPDSLPSLETLFQLTDVRSLADVPEVHSPSANTDSAMDATESTSDKDTESKEMSTNLSTEESDTLNKQFAESCRTDTNDDWCSICKDGGDLICCSFCPRVFHMSCHVPAIPIAYKLIDGDWQCMMCTDVLNCQLPSEGSKRKVVAGTLSGRDLMICERMLLEMLCHPKSLAFHHKVSSRVPNYFKIIKKPMDLTTMQTKLSVSCFERYADVKEFIADMLLIFSNCRIFNDVGSDLYSTAGQLELFFNDLLCKYLPEHTLDKMKDRSQATSQDSLKDESTPVDEVPSDS